jgi:hypothetical protein
MATFKIGINMAGAISAGAYTAGVLDFLTEALDEWQQAKQRREPVPSHDVSIEVISGASAGGMCAAISAVMLQEDFEHIHDTSKTGTTNRFYESWVNQIDIKELLKTGDLKSAPPVVSLLDSTIIENIASYALTPGTPSPTPRAYVSPNLTLFLSLTNLRGMPYSLNGSAPGSIEETTFFFGDRIRFETLHPGKTTPPDSAAHLLDFTKPGAAGGWNTLQTAAMATGAFPLFLAPRILTRQQRDYTPPMWESVTSAATGTPPPISPNFPPGTPDPLETLNVDGGMTNNDPFNYAHDHLARLAPAIDTKTPIPAIDADRAVISIAPFPTTDKFDISYQPRAQSSVLSVLGRLVSTLISQSRFFGESLDHVMSGATFNRFVIAPSDHQLAVRYHGISAQPPALQCAALGAFGGFFHRGFRAHDYALGRRNCQKFLTGSFVLPENNAIIKAGLDILDPAARQKVVTQFTQPPPGTYAHSAESLQKMGLALPASQTATAAWIPIIPLCTDALKQTLAPVERVKMDGAAVDRAVSLILGRLKAIVPVLLSNIHSKVLRMFLALGLPIIRFLGRRPLRDTLIKQLGDSYRP